MSSLQQGVQQAVLVKKAYSLAFKGKPYVCKTCLSKFNQKTNLKVHEKIHSGEKRFVCKYEDCGSRFRTKADLKYHEGSSKHLYEFLV